MIAELLARGPIVTDGAWGTQLQARGLTVGESPDIWNIEHPERVEEVARAYVDAGSDVILTNTFRANRLVLGARAAEIARAGAAISRRAADGKARVFGSIGPSGKLLAAGEADPQELFGVFAEQARALAAGGVDAILIETISDLDEAAIAVAAARDTGLPVIASMVFDSGRNRDRTMTGATPESAAKSLTAAGADVIGANCGRGIEGYVEICRRMRAASSVPLWIKPNAGLPELVDGKAVYRTSAEAFARYVPALVSAGASFIGGCCGSGPDFIRAIREQAGRCD